MENRKPQTAECHVTTALQSCLQFVVHVWTAGEASSSKWFMARCFFFVTREPRLHKPSGVFWPPLPTYNSYIYSCVVFFWLNKNELNWTELDALLKSEISATWNFKCITANCHLRFLMKNLMLKVSILPSDNSRTTWETPWSRATWTTA